VNATRCTGAAIGYRQSSVIGWMITRLNRTYTSRQKLCLWCPPTFSYRTYVNRLWPRQCPDRFVKHGWGILKLQWQGLVICSTLSDNDTPPRRWTASANAVDEGSLRPQLMHSIAYCHLKPAPTDHSSSSPGIARPVHHRAHVREHHRSVLRGWVADKHLSCAREREHMLPTVRS
jgi:hypothetical protein